MSGCVGDGPDDEAGVAVVDAGQGVVEADRNSAGDAGGQAEHASYSSAAWQLADVGGGDRGFPVGAGHQGDIFTDARAGGDEPAGEVLAVQPAPAVDQKAGACLKGMDAAGAGARGGVKPAGGSCRSWGSFRGGRGGDGAARDVGERGHAELDCFALAAQGRLDLGELVLGAGEADLEALDLAEPAFSFGFGDAVVQVGADLFQPAALGGVRPQE